MADLTTRYLGLTLRTPIVASASPIAGTLDGALRLEDAGAAAVVLPSLVEEEVLHEETELDRLLERGTDAFAEALDFFPALPTYTGPGERYLAHLEAVASRLSVPVVASLNATAPGSWARYARWMADAGAAAVELNLYRVAAEPDRSAADVEADDVAAVAAVRQDLDVPLAVKLSPYYSATAHLAARLVAAGAHGLVLFNRFYAPDLDVETLDVAPRLELSRPWELRLPLRWIAVLRPQLGPGVGLAATSGVSEGVDVVKALAVGADVAMTTSALLRRGPEHLMTMEAALETWLDEHGYASVAELRGCASQGTASSPAAFERAGYLRTLHSWS